MNLVFASGFLIPQRLLGIDYFRGVREHLDGSHETIFPPVPPAGTVDERAGALADAVHQRFPSGPVHIIAHSIGRLDGPASLIARNLHGLAEPGRIVSLTTLSTPHRGSPVADLLAGPRPNDLRRLIYDGISNAIHLLKIETGALANLTTRNALAVPDPTVTHPHIRYRSFAAAGRSGTRPTCFLLAPTHHYVHAVTGQDNDGVVAVNSARFGEFQDPPWPCDHVDMVGHNLDTADLGRFQFDHLAAIGAIIAAL